MQTALMAAIKKAAARQKYKETPLHKKLRSLRGVVRDPANSKFKVSPQEFRTSHDNILFDSKLEKDRYEELLLLQKAGKIEHLHIQKKFVLLGDIEINGRKERGISYIADFHYFDQEQHGKEVVEEWKVQATKTKEYKLKRKLFLQAYPYIEFREMVGDLE